MKVAVIGCTHAGTAAIVNTKKLYPDAEVVVYERNDNISFLSCGIALYVQGVVKDPAGLFYSSPEALKDLGVKTKMKHDVLDVDIENKSIRVEDLSNGQTFEDNFDKLIITTGSWPIVPNFEGGKLDNILLSKNFDHSNEIIRRAKDVDRVVVIGAGYIGVELVEAFNDNGKEVVLIDAMDRILSKYLDKEFTDKAEKTFIDRGVKLAMGEMVTKFEGDDGKVKRVVTDKGSYDTDLVIMCIGFRPNTNLFKGQIDMLDNGAIVVDEYMRTSNPDVLAAGDACAIHYNPTDQKSYIPLATNAIRMGTLAALNLVDKKYKYMGTQGTSGIKIFENNMASTGLTEASAKIFDVKYDTVTVKDSNRPEFMPDYSEVMLKILFDPETHVLLGAQIHSEVDMTQTVNALSLALQNKMTVEELAFVDFFFQPHYNKPWNIMNLAGLAAIEKFK